MEATQFHYTPTEIIADFELFRAVGLELRLRQFARDEVKRHG